MIGFQSFAAHAERAAPFPGFGLPRDSLRATLVDQIDCGLIVCDAQAVLQFANRAGEDELASERVLRRRGDSLRVVGPSNAALDAALRGAAVKGRRQLLALEHDGDRLMATLIPLPQPGSELSLVLLVLGRRGPCSALGLELLAGAYRLTLAERRVLAGLMADIAPRDIAAAHGVALSTVRTQIAAIRTKFGVRNVESLLIRAAEVPPVPSALMTGRSAYLA